MENSTLQFSSILELVDFQIATDKYTYSINANHLTITGKFTEAEIELAIAGYTATLLDA